MREIMLSLLLLLIANINIYCYIKDHFDQFWLPKSNGEVITESFLESKIFNLYDMYESNISIFEYQNQSRQNILQNRGVDSKFFNISLSGLELNSSLDGYYDLRQIQSEAISHTRYQFVPSAKRFDYANLNINFIPHSYKSTLAKVFASNQLGYVSARFGADNIKSFDWFIGYDYFTMPDFNISRDNNAIFGVDKNYRKNSELGNFNLLGKVSLKDSYSKLTLNYLMNNLKSDVPYNIYGLDSVFRNNNRSIQNIVNLEFDTEMGGFEYMNGNVFFLSSKRNIDLYSDSNHTIPYSNHSTNNFSSYSYGLNLLLNFDNETSLIDILGFGYRKEDIYLNYINNQPEVPINVERLKLRIEKILNFYGDKIFRMDLALELYINRFQNNLLNVTSRFSGMNFYFNSILFFDKFPVYFNMSYLGKSPTMDYFQNDDGFVQLNESKGLLAEIIMLRLKNTENYELSVNMFSFFGYDISSNKFLMQDKNTEAFDYNSMGIEIKNHFVWGKLYMNIDYMFDYITDPSKNDKLNYLFSPKHVIKSSLRYNFDFGLDVMLNANFYSERNNYVSGKLYVLKPYNLINVIISQKLYKENAIFMKVNNLTDQYYENVYGFPGSGILYGVGVNVAF